MHKSNMDIHFDDINNKVKLERKCKVYFTLEPIVDLDRKTITRIKEILDKAKFDIVKLITR